MQQNILIEFLKYGVSTFLRSKYLGYYLGGVSVMYRWNFTQWLSYVLWVRAGYATKMFWEY